MASLPFSSPSPLLTLTRQRQTQLNPTKHHPTSTSLSSSASPSPSPSPSPSLLVCCSSYKVTIEHEGQSTQLEVDPDESILSKALDSGMDIPHDCKLGVCMTCPAKLLAGRVDQSEGMLSDDVVDRGYALLCVAYPRSDCTIRTIPEEELLSLQLATAND